MVTPYILGEYAFTFNTKGFMTHYFIGGIKYKPPSFFKKSENLYLYIVKTCGLTIEEADDTIFKVFKQFLELEGIGLKLNKILDNIHEEKDKLETITFLYNKIIGG